MIQNVAVESLSFYQAEVGIEGPKSSLPDDPVYVVASQNRLVLINGYHRFLYKLLGNGRIMQAYLLMLD